MGKGKGRGSGGGGLRPWFNKAKSTQPAGFKAPTQGLERVYFGFGPQFTPDTFTTAHDALVEYVGANFKKGAPAAVQALRTGVEPVPDVPSEPQPTETKDISQHPKKNMMCSSWTVCCPPWMAIKRPVCPLSTSTTQ